MRRSCTDTPQTKMTERDVASFRYYYTQCRDGAVRHHKRMVSDVAALRLALEAP